MNTGGAFLSLTYVASEKVIPGYGGGMSSAKAQLESDTRVLAFEAGRKWGLRVNTVSAGPLKSRAASAIDSGQGGKKNFIELAIDYSKANAPLARLTSAIRRFSCISRTILSSSARLTRPAACSRVCSPRCPHHRESECER